MTEHEKSRKHYEQSGTYDQNMEYFEECEVNKGRALCEEEREIIWAMQLDGLTETQACEEYFLTKHTEYNNFSICYIPNKEVFAECVAVFGERY